MTKQPIKSVDSKANAGIVSALAPSENGTGNSHVSLSTRLQLDGRNPRKTLEQSRVHYRDGKEGRLSTLNKPFQPLRFR